MARTVIIPDTAPITVQNDEATVEEIRQAMGLLHPQVLTANAVISADGRTITFQRPVGGEKG